MPTTPYNCDVWHQISIWHDDVIKWKHFPRYWPFVRGIHRSPVNSPHKGRWREALMFSLICAWMNDWVNSGEAGDLRSYCTHYVVTVMNMVYSIFCSMRTHWNNNVIILTKCSSSALPDCRHLDEIFVTANSGCCKARRARWRKFVTMTVFPPLGGARLKQILMLYSDHSKHVIVQAHINVCFTKVPVS